MLSHMAADNVLHVIKAPRIAANTWTRRISLLLNHLRVRSTPDTPFPESLLGTRLLCNVPKDSRGVAEIKHSDSPRPHCWRSSHNTRIFFLQADPLNILPPFNCVLDIQTHHEILGVFFYVKPL